MRAFRQGLLMTAREHRFFLVVALLMTLLMTWPTLRYVLDGSDFWLPWHNSDNWMKFWDAWYLGEILRGRGDFFATDLLFYPQGMSLVYHNFSLPHMLALNLLQRLLPPAAAYNLIWLLIVFTVQCSAYIYCHYVLRQRHIAALCAVIVGISPHMLAKAHQPDVAFIASLPLALYCLHRAIAERRLRLWVLAGFLAGCTAFIGMYIFICLLLTLGLLWLALGIRHLSERGFWLSTFAFVLALGSISAVRIVPMLQDDNDLSAVLQKGGGGEEDTDLMNAFVYGPSSYMGEIFHSLSPERGPALQWDNSSYIGYLALVLAALGMLRADARRKMLPWLLLFLVFFVLRLGSELTVHGVTYSHIRLPKYYLNRLVPAVFTAFQNTDYFQVGVLLPIALLAGYGAKAWLPQGNHRLRTALVLLLIGIVAVEYHRSHRPQTLHEGQLDFLQWLDKEEPAPTGLIHLPMGRGHSKRYGFYQTYNGYPHAEGLASRTIPSSYTYIENNLILATWRDKHSPACGRDPARFQNALGQLLADRFSHVLIHPSKVAPYFGDSFTGLRAAYADEFVFIYRLADLRATCPDTYLRQLDPAPAIAQAMLTTVLQERHGTVLSLDTEPAASTELLQYLTRHSFDGKEYLQVENTQATAPNILSSAGSFKDIKLLDEQLAIWVVSRPGTPIGEAAAPIWQWLRRHFRRCQRAVDGERVLLDLYLRHDAPCAAVADFAILQYGQRARLQHATTALERQQLQVYLGWTQIGNAKTSYSLQIYDDADGQKVLQSDWFIERKLLAGESFDLRQLPPGQYRLELIVYDSETLASIHGSTADGERQKRALELATFSL